MELNKLSLSELELLLQEKTVEAQRLNSIQYAYKIALNSLYGAFGTRFFRYYDVRMAEAVTCTGQTVIKWTQKITNDYLNKLFGNKEEKDYIVAIDTDSVFVKLDEVVECACGTINPPVDLGISVMDKMSNNKLLPMMMGGYDKLHHYLNTYKKRMQIERETLGDAGIFVAKKKYVINIWDNEGVRYAEPHFKIRGLEIVRSSTPEVCREAIKQAVRVIFDKGESGVQKFIKEFKEKFNSYDYTSIAFPRGVNEIEKWVDGSGNMKSGVPIHVRGAIVYNNALKQNKLDKKHTSIHEKDKVKFMYLKMPNPVHQNVIAFPDFLPKELDLEQYVDFEVQFEKAFLSPLKAILDALSWDIEEKSSLENLFT